MQVDADVPAGVVNVLVAQHIAENAVVEHQGDQPDPVARGRCQLLYAEHEAAVPGHGDDRPLRIGGLDAKRSLEPEAQIALKALRDIGSGRQNGYAEVGCEAHLADFRDNEAVPRQQLPNHLPVGDLGLNPLNQPLRLGLGRGDLLAAPAPVGNHGRQLGNQGRAGVGGVRNQRMVRNEPLHLLRVDVDANQHAAVLRAAPVSQHAGPTHVLHFQPGADAEQKVAVIPKQPCGDGGHAQRMIFGDQAAAAAQRGDRAVQQLRQSQDFIGRILGAGAAHDHRPAGCGDGLRRRLQSILVQGRLVNPAVPLADGQVVGSRHAVPGHVDGDRAGPPAGHDPKRLVDRGAGLHWVFDVDGVLDDAAQGAGLIPKFVQVAAPDAHEGGGDLPSHAEHLGAGAHGRAEGGAGVQHAGPRHHRAGRRPAGGFRRPEGHVGGALLMFREDGLHLAPVPLQRVPQGIGLHAGYAEQLPDAVFLGGQQHGFAAGHFWH